MGPRGGDTGHIKCLMAVMDDSVRVVTWNVNGLLDKIKRGAVLRYAKHLGADILLLQETHVGD